MITGFFEAISFATVFSYLLWPRQRAFERQQQSARDVPEVETSALRVSTMTTFFAAISFLKSACVMRRMSMPGGVHA